MAVLDHLEPKSVFSFFEQLCAYPHGSGNTKQISDWLVSFAKDRGLEYYQDELNNVIMIKPASAGYEAAPAVILQGHMDMVCEKAPDCTKDMAAEGLDLAVDGDVVYAKGTTLGGDNGVAVAMMLAALDDDSLPHPRLEAVFTVDEETGMFGAAGLDVTPLQGRIMLNMDSEEEGVFTVSCAGGNMSRCTFPVRRAPFGGKALSITVEGLQGGHSGISIHKGLGNANMLLGRVLAVLNQTAGLRIDSVRGGLKDNAIPVQATATVVVENEAAARKVCEEMGRIFADELCVTDPGVQVKVEEAACERPMDEASTGKVLTLLTCAPNGVQHMSADIEGLVQTSLNLGVLDTTETSVYASFCVRSSVESQKRMLEDRLACLMAQLGGSLEVEGDYPGWQYRQESPLRDLMVQVYRSQYGCAPKIEAIHAGVECGLFAGKLPGLDCVSYGPNLTEIHTFREKMQISSVQRTWEMTKEVLRRIK